MVAEWHILVRDPRRKNGDSWGSEKGYFLTLFIFAILWFPSNSVSSNFWRRFSWKFSLISFPFNWKESREFLERISWIKFNLCSLDTWWSWMVIWSKKGKSWNKYFCSWKSDFWNNSRSWNNSWFFFFLSTEPLREKWSWTCMWLTSVSTGSFCSLRFLCFSGR